MRSGRKPLACFALTLLCACGGSGTTPSIAPLRFAFVNAAARKAPIWPTFKFDVAHDGLAPYSTASDTGKLRWEFTTQGGIPSSPAIGADGTVYFGAFDDFLYAIDGSTGKMKWSFLTDFLPESSPSVAADGTIYEGTDGGHVYALTPAGKRKWAFDLGSPCFSSPTIGIDGTVYVGSRAGALFAITPTGKLRWSFRTSNDIDSQPALGKDGSIYFTSENGFLYALSPGGKLKWKYQMGAESNATPAVGDDGTIYAGSNTTLLYAFSPQGKVRWTFATGDALATVPAVTHDMVYVGSATGYFYAIAIPGRKQQSWQWPARGKPAQGAFAFPAGSPIISADGTIYIDNFYIGPSRTGNALFAFKKGSHSPVALFTNPKPFGDTPAIGRDGTLYVGTFDHHFFAIH